MRSGSQFALRYRGRRSRLAPVAAQLVVPVVLGLLIGGVLAYQAGSTNNAVQPVPLGAVPTPTPSWIKPSSAPAGAVAAPSPAWLAPPKATTSSAVRQAAAAHASGRLGL